MRVGDIGCPVTYTPPTGLDLTGATVTLFVAIGPPSVALLSKPMTVAPGGKSATYNSAGNEWPDVETDEDYDCWTTVLQPGGDFFTSDTGTITVKAAPRSAVSN